MAESNELYLAVEAALQTVPGITVYDGYVPDVLPETDGYIDPYVVVWSGSGANPDEVASCGRQDTATLIWDFQTTVVGAAPSTCRLVAQAVEALLTNFRAGTGRVRRNPDGFNQQYPILDTQTSPARFMLPLQWRLITN